MRGDLEDRLRELLDEEQLSAVIELLERERMHDPLTGLPNRVLLLDRTATALARLRRGSWRVALMHVGIDRLNVLNETLGPERRRRAPASARAAPAQRAA